MKAVIVAVCVILAAYAFVFFAALEKSEDHPRFHIETPIPAEADTAAGEPGVYGGRVLIGAMGDPKTLNPVVSSETSSRDIWARMVSSLIGMDNVTQEVMPSLASHWEFSEDNLSLTFHMRRGVVWSDGVPVTAYDMEFSYNVVYDERVENSLSDIMRVNGEPFVGTAIDSFTFKVTIPDGTQLTDFAVSNVVYNLDEGGFWSMKDLLAVAEKNAEKFKNPTESNCSQSNP